MKHACVMLRQMDHSVGPRPLKIHSDFQRQQLLPKLSQEYSECFQGILTMDISASSSPRLFCLWLGSSMSFKQTQERRETGRWGCLRCFWWTNTQKKLIHWMGSHAVTQLWPSHRVWMYSINGCRSGSGDKAPFSPFRNPYAWKLKF